MTKAGETPAPDIRTADARAGNAQMGETQVRGAQESDAQKGGAQEGNARKGDARKGNAQRGNAQKSNAQKGNAQKGGALWLMLCNAPDAEIAQRLARTLVESRLVACVNLLPGVQSVYRWQGAVETASEVTLLIKTTGAQVTAVEAALVEAHPYDVPEVVAWPAGQVNAPYLAWVRESVAGNSEGNG
jgi:periplasmic divalent cation tolerance protein